jgi:hypothetical protein
MIASQLVNANCLRLHRPQSKPFHPEPRPGTETQIDLLRIQAQITQGAIEAVNVFLEPEGSAVKGARHVEGTVAVSPTPVAERDQYLILGHELAVEPGEAGIG